MGLLYPHLKQFDMPIDNDFAPMYIQYPYVILMSNKLRVKHVSYLSRSDRVNMRHLLLYDNLLNSLPSINVINNLDEIRRKMMYFVVMMDIKPNYRDRLIPMLHDALDYPNNYEGFVMPATLELMFTIMLQQYDRIQSVRPAYISVSEFSRQMTLLYLYARLLNHCI